MEYLILAEVGWPSAFMTVGIVWAIAWTVK